MTRTTTTTTNADTSTDTDRRLCTDGGEHDVDEYIQRIRDNVPGDLLGRAQWVCWKEEERDGDMTKIPVDPTSGGFAKSNDSSTWCGFGDAADYHRENPETAGLGFMFADDGPFMGVDLDKCRNADTGEVDDWAEDICDTLSSYTETSTSGTGFHVLLANEVPGSRSRKGEVEMYDNRRFFVMTGDQVSRYPDAVHERTDELEDVYEEYVLPEDTTLEEDNSDDDSASVDPPSRGTTPSELGDDESGGGTRPPAERDGSASLDDEELVKKALRSDNGDKFERLWGGQTTGYESQSEADMALACLLAFWTRGDKGQMDRLFRNSGLYREKWNEVHYSNGDTYGERTLANAVDTIDEFYDPEKAARDGETVEVDEDVPDPKSTDFIGSERDQAMGDASDEDVLVSASGEDGDGFDDVGKDTVMTMGKSVQDHHISEAARQADAPDTSRGATVDEDGHAPTAEGPGASSSEQSPPRGSENKSFTSRDERAEQRGDASGSDAGDDRTAEPPTGDGPTNADDDSTDAVPASAPSNAASDEAPPESPAASAAAQSASDGVDKTVAMMQDRLDTTEQQVNNQRETIRDLREVVDNLRTRNERLRETVQTAERTIKDHRSRIEDLEQAVATLSHERESAGVASDQAVGQPSQAFDTNGPEPTAEDVDGSIAAPAESSRERDVAAGEEHGEDSDDSNGNTDSNEDATPGGPDLSEEDDESTGWQHTGEDNTASAATADGEASDDEDDDSLLGSIF